MPKRPYLDMGLAILKMDKDQGSELHTFKDYQQSRTQEVELILEPG